MQHADPSFTINFAYPLPCYQFCLSSAQKMSTEGSHRTELFRIAEHGQGSYVSTYLSICKCVKVKNSKKLILCISKSKSFKVYVSRRNMYKK